MFYAYAKWIHRLRWGIIALWLALVVAAALWLPNLGTVVSHQNQNFLSATDPVIQAGDLLNKINPKQKSQSSAVVAIVRSAGLTAADKQYFRTKLSQIQDDKAKYDASYIQSAFNTNKQVASSFMSRDGTTQIALIGLKGGEVDSATTKALDNLHQVFNSSPSGLKVYFTGDAPIQQDDIQISQDGAKKTTTVTIVLVLAILLLVFRSLLAPLVTLLSIGMSFMISSGVVAWLAERGFPSSTFTQTFLIAVMFGAGTDYSIIILNRFREELTKDHGDKTTAMADALKAITKTIVFSALTVLVSFAILYFANFGLYRSGVGVAIGIAIILLCCLTFIPALMSLLGRSLYWPRKPQPGMEHRPSRIWSWTSRVAVRRPWWTLAVLVIVLLPVASLFTNDRTFDPMVDIPQAPSVQGFHAMAKAFGPGEVLPMNIVLTTNSNLRTSRGLTTIDNISRSLSALPEVKSVNSATRPTGKLIKAFQLSTQNQQLASGLADANAGLNKLASQLNAAGRPSNAQSGMQKLLNGSNQVTTGAKQLQNGLASAASQSKPLAAGATQVASGANQIATQLSRVSSGLRQTGQGATQVAEGLKNITPGAQQVAQGSSQLSQSQQQLANAASNLANAIAQWSKANPQAASSPQWQQIAALAQALQTGTQKSAAASTQLASGAKQVAGALPQLASGATQVSQATTSLASGVTKLSQAASQLSGGATKVAQGTGQFSSGMKQLTQGAGALQSGSAQVTQGIATVSSSMQQAIAGYGKAGKGASTISKGLSQLQQYLKKTGQSSSVGNPGFYVPASQVASNKGLHQAMDAYISPDGHIAKFTVILSTNPYGTQAINAVPKIEQAARLSLESSPISSGEISASGTTPVQSDINQISSKDFTRTVVLILASIFVLLVAMLRSLIAPFYVILSLAGTYFITMGILQTLVDDVLHKPGVSWAAPFFVFLLLVALGVDYSIFLMSRFEEEMERGLSPAAAISEAMGRMGNIIFSAAIIMAGTFGSMTVAGVTSLVEIGLAVVIGLIMYTVFILAFFVPASAAIVGEAHSWPFRWKETVRSRHLRAKIEAE